MRSFAVLSLAALAAVATAAPHAQNHRHVFSSLAGRSIMDGKCGGSDGNCEPGYCCSQYGYCGKTPDYCGAGCNSAFGTCGSGQAPPAQHSSSVAAPQSKDHPRPTSTYTQVFTTTMTRPSSSAAAAPTSHPAVYSTPSAAPPASSSAPAASSSYAPAPTGGSHSGSNTYKVYTGDGTTGAGWPSQDAWVDFESMWNANMKLISISCTQFGQPNNSPDESAAVKAAIQSIGSSSGIDSRFILAIMMQESKGCVRAPTTNYGVRNPGLMQSHDGAGTCNDASAQNPCPSNTISQMIKDGATGTAAGDGLEQTVAQAHCSDVSKYYKGARIYNSGSIAAGGDLGQGIATHCYSSDVANRLTGWVDAPTTCHL